MSDAPSEPTKEDDVKPFRVSHIRALDGLRGVAIVLVLCSHLLGVGYAGFGLELFFVLSGFLITLLLADERDRHGKIKLSYFYMRRLLRLLPALCIALGGAYLASLLGWLVFPTWMIPYILTYTTNLGVAFNGLPTDRDTNPFYPMWSLAIEEQFYTVWPLVFVWLCEKTRCRYPIRPLIVLLLIWEAYRWWIITHSFSVRRIYFSTDTHAQVLLVGGLLALIRLERPRNIVTSSHKWTSFFWNFYILVVFALVVFNPGSFDLYNLTGTFWGFAFGGLVWATTVPSLKLYHSFLEMTWLRFLGKVSYGLYLFHIPIHVSCETLMGDTILTRCLAFIISIVLAWLSYTYLELPILRRKKKYQQ